MHYKILTLKDYSNENLFVQYSQRKSLVAHSIISNKELTVTTVGSFITVSIILSSSLPTLGTTWCSGSNSKCLVSLT